MGAFASGLASGIAGGINKKKARDKEQGPKLQEFKKPEGAPELSDPVEYKRGGKVRKGGRAKVHKGERVLTKHQARKFERKRGRK